MSSTQTSDRLAVRPVSAAATITSQFAAVMLTAVLIVVPGRALAETFLVDHSAWSTAQILDLVTIAALSGALLTYFLTMLLRPLMHRLLDRR